MPQNSRNLNDGQIRLLLPSDWIEELDTLAGAQFKTRLALIRQYLREKIDEDLSGLSESIIRRRQIHGAKVVADNWILERQRREEEEDDEW